MTASVGSKYYAIDFHVHTTASEDYKQKDATPLDIVNAALSANLDAIVITDHNTINGIDAVRDAAKDTNLTVFPGFEVNTKGGHVLGVFDPNTKIEDLETALIQSGIKKREFGIEKAIGDDIEEVFKAIAKNGGIAIAAHVDGEKGFMQTIAQGAAKVKIYHNQNLSAIEIVDLSIKDQYIEGKQPEYNRALACVQGSDAHKTETIGKRRTLLKMQHLTLEGLKQAFSEPKLRIKFPNDAEEVTYPHIVKMKVSQGFLADQEIIFNNGFNCLVGGAGSGKSTVIEFLRFALDQVSTIQAIADDCEGKVRELAKNGARIFVLLQINANEQYMVSRTYNGADNPISIVHYPSKEPTKDINIQNFFKIHAYSQGEAISIARDRLAQLDLIDKHLDLSSYKREISNSYFALKQQKGIVTLQGIVNNKGELEKEKSTLQHQRQSFQKELESIIEVQKNPIVTSHHKWIQEQEYLKQLLESVQYTRDSISSEFDQLNIPVLSVQELGDGTPNAERISSLLNQVRTIENAKKRAKELLAEQIRLVEQEIKSVFTDWDKLFDAHNNQYQNLAADASTKKVQEINAQLETIAKKERKTFSELDNVRAAEKTLTSELDKRKSLFEKIKDQKARIRVSRERKAKDFVTRLGKSVSIKLIPDGNIDEYEEFVVNVMKGNSMRRETIRQLCKSINPWDFANLLRAHDVKQIVDKSQLDERWSKILIDVFNGNQERILELESVPVEDSLEISYRVGDTYKPLEKLSTGQKATVIVLLSMVEGKYPIVFDQPEDALYTPFIYTDVVKTLREEKDRRQFIFATHNSNIAIGGDSDFGIILDSTSDQTTISASGALDDTTTKGLMLIHLEGGEEAFLMRQKKFGLDKPTHIS